jgi:hypothetical protein
MSIVKLAYIEELKGRAKSLVSDKYSISGQKLGDTRNETFKERAKSLFDKNYFKTHTWTGKVAQ